MGGRADLQGVAGRPVHQLRGQEPGPSVRARRDAELKGEMHRVFGQNFGVYGQEKLWRQLNREGVEVGRDRVARLMRETGLVGARRGLACRTTVSDKDGERPSDLVDRRFLAAEPNRLWVADLTYVWTRAGFCYVAFVTDAFSRRIVGWRVSTSLRVDVALERLGDGHLAPARQRLRARAPLRPRRATQATTSA